jgi:hypothetical protein
MLTPFQTHIRIIIPKLNFLIPAETEILVKPAPKTEFLPSCHKFIVYEVLYYHDEMMKFKTSDFSAFPQSVETMKNTETTNNGIPVYRP